MKLHNGFIRNELAELMWKKPHFAQIELTRNCNFKCLFCFENCDATNKYQDKSYKEWMKVIKELKDLGIKQLHFSGGENFLYKNFVQIIKFAKEEGFEVIINTNGFFDITPIIEYSDEFIFSVHGYRDLNDKITNGKNTFNHVEKNIERALEKKKRVLINTVLIKDNFYQYMDLFKYLDNKYNNLMYSPTIAIECNTGKKILDELELNQKTMQKYEKILSTIGEEKIVYKHGMSGLRSSKKKENFYMPVCAAGKSKLIIKYNGNVYPCNFFQTDDYFCGNVFEDKIENIWKERKRI